MENLGIDYGHFVYITATGNILWPFSTFCGHLVYFSPVLVFCTKKNLATLHRLCEKTTQTIFLFEIETPKNVS
jgi:hypothetical protein